MIEGGRLKMEKLLERFDYETDFEYGLRLMEAKCNKEIECDWQDIVEHLDLGIHRDSLRKAFNVGAFSGFNIMKYYKEKLEEATLNHSGASELVDDLFLELEQKKMELKKERIKIQTLRNDLNRSLREESRKELFYEQLLDEVRKNPILVPDFEPLSRSNDTNREFIQIFSDIHYGAQFDIGENQYSPEICHERFQSLLTETLMICEKEGVNHLTIANCGDSIQSLLRLSDLTLNSLTVIEQVMGIARLIANYLNELSRTLTIRYIHTIQANHSEFRLLGTKRGELQEDVELLIANWIHDLLINNPRVEVVIAKDTIHTEDVCGYSVGFLHGQDVKNFETFIRDASFHYKTNYSYMIMGHIHHLRNITIGTGEQGEAIQIISCPSLVGSCEYSKKLMKSSPAAALMLGFEAGRGKFLSYELTL